MHSRRASLHAFTLVELAIVLAIVGLLAGAIIAGTQFIRSGEVNKVGTTLNASQAGYIQFHEKYNGIPGDLIDAESYFGSDAGCPNSTTRTPKRATCNGNGDGAVTGTETFRAIQQMANGGYIAGQFSGVAGTGGAEHAVPGENVPAGPNRSGILMVSEGPYSGHGVWFDMPPSVVMQIGRVSGGRPTGGFLTPKNAMGLDRKIDDGLPGSGTLITYRGACAADEANYQLGSTTESCALAYRTGASRSVASSAAINGACNNAIALGCSAGSATNDNGQTACGTTRTWHCNGANGGTNATNCSRANAACGPVVNGACNNSTALGCSAGTAANDNGEAGCGTIRTWTCQGSGGGSNSGQCSMSNPACSQCESNGVCSPSGGCGPNGDHVPFLGPYGCTPGCGSACGTFDMNDEYFCDCQPPPEPVNGVCINDHTRSCASGHKDLEQDMNGYWTWRCMGANGGTNDTCCTGIGCDPLGESCFPGECEINAVCGGRQCIGDGELWIDTGDPCRNRYRCNNGSLQDMGKSAPACNLAAECA